MLGKCIVFVLTKFNSTVPQTVCLSQIEIKISYIPEFGQIVSKSEILNIAT